MRALTPNFHLEELIANRWASEEEQAKSNASLTDAILANLLELAENLQVLRNYLGKPVIVNIAFRPQWWELKQGRSGKGQHPLGKAADIKVKGLTPKQLKAVIEKLISEGKMKQGGIGLYSTFVHYDTRGYKARWKQ